MSYGMLRQTLVTAASRTLQPPSQSRTDQSEALGRLRQFTGHAVGREAGNLSNLLRTLNHINNIDYGRWFVHCWFSAYRGPPRRTHEDRCPNLPSYGTSFSGLAPMVGRGYRRRNLVWFV